MFVNLVAGAMNPADTNIRPVPPIEYQIYCIKNWKRLIIQIYRL